MAKIVSNSKFQEKKGLDRVSRIVHEEMKCLFQVISQDDYGIDGEIQICQPLEDGTGHESTGKFIKVQIKSGQSYVLNETPESFFVRSRLDDLRYWKDSNIPIFFIVYNPNDDSLYYKDIKAYINEKPEVMQTPHKIDFSKEADKFGTNAISFINSIVNIIPAKIDRTGKENLFSNLIQFKQIPPLFSFRIDRDTKFFDDSDFAYIVAMGDTFYTFLNVENHLVKKYTSFKFQELRERSYENDRRLKSTIVLKLLYSHIRAYMKSLGLSYNEYFKRFYFPIDRRFTGELRRSWKNPMVTNSSSAKRLIYKKYRYGSNEFYRQAAVSYSINFLGPNAFLALNPEYFFTVDGEIPFAAEKVGALNTRVIAMKDNRNYFNDVCFWLYILNGQNQKEFINISSVKQVTISLFPKLMSGISNFRILDDPVEFREFSDDPLQLNFEAFE